MAGRVRKPLTEEQRQRNLEANRRWKARNKNNEEYREKRRASWRAYREKNLEKCREASNRYKRENWQKVQEKHRIYLKEYAARLRKASSAAPNSAEARARVLSHNEIFAAATKAVPRGIAPWKREDIIGDIVLAVLEGEIGVTEIAARAKDFIKDYNRRFSEFMNIEFDETYMQPAE